MHGGQTGHLGFGGFCGFVCFGLLVAGFSVSMAVGHFGFRCLHGWLVLLSCRIVLIIIMKK